MSRVSSVRRSGLVGLGAALLLAGVGCDSGRTPEEGAEVPWLQIAEGGHQPSSSGLGVIVHLTSARGSELRVAVSDGVLDALVEGDALSEADNAVFAVGDNAVITVVVKPTDTEAVLFARLRACENPDIDPDAGPECMLVASAVRSVRIPTSNLEAMDGGVPAADAQTSPDARVPDTTIAVPHQEERR